MAYLFDSSIPNFYWKNFDAFLDMGCIVESEIPEVSPTERIEVIEIVGRNGELHESFGDYAAYDLTIPKITIPYDRLPDIKGWLRGHSRLITHNDQDKYRDCICSMGKEIQFENEWGVFYTFSVTFRCQPFKKKINDVPNSFHKGVLNFHDMGDDVASPYFEVEAVGGDFSLSINDKTLIVLNALPGLITIDTELGKILQESNNLFSKGEWPKILPGKNQLIASGAIENGLMYKRSVFL